MDRVGVEESKKKLIIGLNINMLNSNFNQHKKIIWQENLSISSRKYLIALVLIITATSLNCFYSIAMMFLTAFTLAYLTKGSRCK